LGFRRVADALMPLKVATSKSSIERLVQYWHIVPPRYLSAISTAPSPPACSCSVRNYHCTPETSRKRPPHSWSRLAAHYRPRELAFSPQERQDQPTPWPHQWLPPPDQPCSSAASATGVDGTSGSDFLEVLPSSTFFCRLLSLAILLPSFVVGNSYLRYSRLGQPKPAPDLPVLVAFNNELQRVHTGRQQGAGGGAETREP